jgi:membrane-associated PAP2 superfamily phosphatase
MRAQLVVALVAAAAVAVSGMSHTLCQSLYCREGYRFKRLSAIYMLSFRLVTLVTLLKRLTQNFDECFDD